MQNLTSTATKISLVCTRMLLPDVPIVSELEKRCFPAPWSADTYRHELLHNARSFYSVIRPGSTPELAQLPPILGYAGYWLLDGEAHIMTIAIHPDWQRHKLGEWLLLEILASARTKEAHQATLEVRMSNNAAISLYTKLGFGEVGLRKRYYRDNGEDARLLTLFDLDKEVVWQPLVGQLDELRAVFSRTVRQ